MAEMPSSGTDGSAEYFTIKQVAARESVSYRTVLQWTRHGKLKAEKVRGHIQIKVCDLQDFLLKSREPVTPKLYPSELERGIKLQKPD